MVRMRTLLLSLGLLVCATTSCATAPKPGDHSYAFNVAGSYAGRFTFDNQRFDATLQLRTHSGGEVTGGFRVSAPVEIDGGAVGAIVDNLLRLAITYRSPAGCDGRIEGILTIEEGGTIIDGPVTVTDCGAPVAGRMSFRRR